jgi:hypothetical protein
MNRSVRAATRAANAGWVLVQSLQLLPILLPSRQTAADARGQSWNVSPAHDRRRTVLDGLPTPTDQRLRLKTWHAVMCLILLSLDQCY